MFVLLLAGDLNERLLGFPELLLELVDHRGVLALDEAVQVVPGVATAMTGGRGLFFLSFSPGICNQKSETRMVKSMKARFELTNVLRPCFRMSCEGNRVQLRGKLQNLVCSSRYDSVLH